MGEKIRPFFTAEMVRELGFFDVEGPLKKINYHLAHIYKAIDGECEHVPSKIVAMVSGDFSDRVQARGSICLYCSKPIEIAEIRWRIKDVQNM